MVMSDEELLREMRQAKSPTEHIQVLADLNAVPAETMREHLRTLGVELPKVRRNRAQYDTQKVRELLAKGATDAEAAEAVGTTASIIRNYRRTHNIPANRQKKPSGVPTGKEKKGPGVKPVTEADAGAAVHGGAEVLPLWAVTMDGEPALYLRRREIAEAIWGLIALDRSLGEEAHP